GTRTGGPSSGERPLPGTVRSHVARLPFSSRRDVRRRRTGRGRSSLQAAAATRAPAGGDGVTLASRCRVSDVGEGGRTMFLVVGATGTLGGSIAKKLLQAGERVRVLVRGSSPARAHGPHTDPEELRQAGAEVVSGDLRDPESLRRAAQGVRVVVSTAPGTKRAPPDTTGAVDGEGTANLAAAATEAGVARFVLVSAAGAGEGAPAGLLQDKWRGEEALRASGVPHAILRPARFMGDWIGFLLGAQLAGGGGVVELVGDAEKPSSFVDEPDVAEVAARLARDPGSGPAEVHALSAERATYP